MKAAILSVIKEAVRLIIELKTLCAIYIFHQMQWWDISRLTLESHAYKPSDLSSEPVHLNSVTSAQFLGQCHLAL